MGYAVFGIKPEFEPSLHVIWVVVLDWVTHGIELIKTWLAHWFDEKPVPVIVSKVSYVILRGEMDVTLAALHVVKSIELRDADAFTLEHEVVSSDWARGQVVEVTGVVDWRPLRSA